jgi:hypothetical protein
MKIKSTILLLVLPFVSYAIKGTLNERLDALEYSVGVPLTGADIENEDYKSPETYVQEKYEMTDSELLSDIIALSQRYTIAETNDEKRVVRNASIRLMGYYASTNELAYLSSIWNNNNDYSQYDALKVAMAISKNSDKMWEIVNTIFASINKFSKEIKFGVYSSLATFSEIATTNSFLDVRKGRIAAFFLERAGLESDMMLYVDRVACDLNPSYRHSQQRRDNLAKLRPIGLTGEQAEIYDGRQRDALPKEEEE